MCCKLFGVLALTLLVVGVALAFSNSPQTADISATVTTVTSCREIGESDCPGTDLCCDTRAVTFHQEMSVDPNNTGVFATFSGYPEGTTITYDGSGPPGTGIDNVTKNVGADGKVTFSKSKGITRARFTITIPEQ